MIPVLYELEMLARPLVFSHSFQASDADLYTNGGATVTYIPGEGRATPRGTSWKPLPVVCGSSPPAFFVCVLGVPSVSFCSFPLKLLLIFAPTAGTVMRSGVHHAVFSGFRHSDTNPTAGQQGRASSTSCKGPVGLVRRTCSASSGCKHRGCQLARRLIHHRLARAAAGTPHENIAATDVRIGTGAGAYPEEADRALSESELLFEDGLLFHRAESWRWVHDRHSFLDHHDHLASHQPGALFHTTGRTAKSKGWSVHKQSAVACVVARYSDLL